MKPILAAGASIAVFAAFTSRPAHAAQDGEKAEGDRGAAKAPDSFYPATSHGRFFFALAVSIGGSTLSAGNKTYKEGSTGRAGVEYGYAHPIALPFLAIVVFGRAGTCDTSFGRSHDESRAAYDIGIGPELRLREKARRPDVEWRLSFPLGYTYMHLRGGEGRAVQESYSDGNGFHASAVLGVDISGSHFGAFANLSYVARFVSVVHRAQSLESPTVVAHEDNGIFDHSIGLSLGVLYRP